MDTAHVRAAKHIQRRTGKTFHLATRLLPERVRQPIYVCYGFFRIWDEIVDDPGDATPAEQQVELERLRAAALGEREPDHPVVGAFRAVCDDHDVPDAEVDAFVDAMATDATPRSLRRLRGTRGLRSRLCGLGRRHDDRPDGPRGPRVARSFRERSRPHRRP